MRRVENYTLGGDYEEPVLTYRDRTGIHTVSLNVGGMYDAEVEVFRDAGTTYVLTWNASFPYAGLEAFVGAQRLGELFLHDRKALEDVLGQSGLELTPLRIAKRLVARLQERSSPRRRSSQEGGA